MQYKPNFYRNLITILILSFIIFNTTLIYTNDFVESVHSIVEIDQNQHDVAHYSFRQRFGKHSLPCRNDLIIGRPENALSIAARVGMLPSAYKQNGVRLVVAKTLTSRMLIHEMELMNKIGNHKNILNYLGYCVHNGVLLVLFDHVEYSYLDEFLRSNNFAHSAIHPRFSKNYEKTLLFYGHQIAEGLEYLSSRGFIHRNLISHNIFVTNDYIIKIGNFNSTRHVHDKDYNSIEFNLLKPKYWMPPESLLHNIYDTKSEVWVYGHLLWEIMNIGVVPHNQTSYHELVQFLRNGERWPKPKFCLVEIYEIILKCWIFQPELRPTFSEIAKLLESILNRM